MGWIWQDSGDDPRSSGDNFGFDISVGSGDGGSSAACSTRKVVKTQCRTEESEPGKFIRKCEKTEQIFKDCVGRPSEMVQSNTEYTEEDVTNQMTKAPALNSPQQVPFDFPGLRSDIEAIERNIFGNLDRFFEAAEDTMNGFFGSFSFPRIHDGVESSPAKSRGIPVEIEASKEPKMSDGDIDFSGLTKDV